MIKIDAHQHYWRYNPDVHTWITDDMKALKKDFMPSDFEPFLKTHKITGSVVIQNTKSVSENYFHVANYLDNDFVKGMVGWIDMFAKDLEDQMAYLSQFRRIKGFRHDLQSEKDISFMLKSKFKKGIGLLRKYDFTYDFLIKPEHLPNAKKLAQQFPDQKFVIDHIAKPDIKNDSIDFWKKNIQSVAECENVFCKISGLTITLSPSQKNNAIYHQYIDTVVDAFGSKRIMFGTDWPACNINSSIDEVCHIVDDYFSKLSDQEQSDFYGMNAAGFYGLDV